MRRQCINRRPFLTRQEFCDCLREFHFDGAQEDFDALFDRYAEVDDVPNSQPAPREMRTWGLNKGGYNRGYLPPANLERRVYFPDFIKQMDQERFLENRDKLVESKEADARSRRKVGDSLSLSFFPSILVIFF